MPRHLGLILLIILCLSSCHQRYWHVKKVKADKNRSFQKEKPSPEKETETRTIFPNDTLPEALVQPEIHDQEPNKKEVVSETRPRIYEKKSGSQEELRQLRPFKELIANLAEDDPHTEPLTFKEKVFIFCVLFVLFAFILLGVLGFLGIVIILIWFYGSLVSTAAFFILTITLIVLILFSFFMSLYLGRNYINKKLNKSLKVKTLILYNLIATILALGAYILPAIVASAFIPSLQIVFWTLVLIAVIYIVLWNFIK